MTKTLEARLSALPNAALAVIYNKIAERQISKFSDHSTAVKRTLAVLEARNMDFQLDDDGQLACLVDLAKAPTIRDGDDRVITVLAEKNPKVKGTKSAVRFAIYENGLTVGAYIIMASELGGGRRKAVRDIAWDTAHGFISLA